MFVSFSLCDQETQRVGWRVGEIMWLCAKERVSCVFSYICV